MYYNNGDKYEGDLKNDKKYGQGILITKEGEIYDGDWKNDEKDGKGILKLSNGNTYFGYFKKNEKHGSGYYSEMSIQENWINGEKVENSNNNP